jgi:hypothetical protein
LIASAWRPISSRRCDGYAALFDWTWIGCLVAGLAWPWLGRIGLGRLPGDILIQRGGTTFYFPLVTCLLISIVLSGLFWLFNR